MKLGIYNYVGGYDHTCKSTGRCDNAGGLGEHVTCDMFRFLSIMKQIWNQFLLVLKASALKQQISKLYPQILNTDVSDHIYVSQWPVAKVKASFCA